MNKAKLKKFYEDYSVFFTVVTVIFIAYLLKLLFTAGFLYLYFGKLIGNINNY